MTTNRGSMPRDSRSTPRYADLLIISASGIIIAALHPAQDYFFSSTHHQSTPSSMVR